MIRTRCRLIGGTLLALGGVMLAARAQQADVAPGPVTFAELSCVTRTWGVDAGLLGTRPYAVAQTRDGYLWVGTREGLFRFNGREFTRFDTARIPETKHPFVYSLCAEHSGRLWIATANFRITCREGDSFVRREELEAYGELDAWIAHPDGGVAIALHKDGRESFAVATPDGHQLVASADLGVARIASLGFSSRGELWAATHGGRLIRAFNGGIEVVTLPNERGTAVLLTWKDGNLAAVGHLGIYECREDTWTLRHAFDPLPKPSEPITHAALDAQGNLWFGAVRAGHWIWSEGSPLRRLVSGRDSAPSPITSLATDADGNIWMTSFSGLYQARYSPFVTRVPPAEIPTPRVVSICEDGRGTIWFSCFGGICRLAPGASEPIVEVTRPALEINNVAGDPRGGFWYVNRFGVVAGLRDEEWVTLRVTAGSRPDSFVPTGMLVEEDGTIWLTYVNGMLRHRESDPDEEFHLVPPEDGLPESYLMGLTRTHDGDLVVGARGDGIYRKPRNSDEWTRVTPTDDLVGWAVRVLTIDSEDRTWAISAREYRLGCWTEEGSWNALLPDLGFDQGRIVGMVCDDEGGLWIATEFHGVAQMDRNQLLARLKDPSQPLAITWFDRSSGLGSKGGSFSTSAIARSADGMIWVATESGLSSINPRQWLANRDRAQPPRLAIEKVTADGQDLPTAGSVRVPAGTVRVAIRYADLSFGLPGEVRFRHRLVGLHDTWIEGGSDSEASFLKVPPGTYRFEAAAANRYGRWSSRPAHVDLFVAPLWWQRTPVRVGLVGIIGLGVLLFYRGRLASLREKESMHAEFSRQLIASQEAERQRLARELHDSLGPNLTIVKNRLTLEQERLAGADSPAPALQAISDVVMQTIHEVRGISRNLRPYALDRAGLTRAIGELVAQVTEATRLPIHSELANIDSLLTAENEINLYRIVQEGLNNVVRHADASQAWLAIERTAKSIRVRLTDDGRGFDRELARGSRGPTAGMGMLSMEERARIMGATFQCKSARREGTTLLIEIPIQPDQRSAATPE